MSTRGISFTRKVLRPAVGRRIGLRQVIAVAFDPQDFQKINVMAQENEVAFQEQVRRLCKSAITSGIREGK